MALNCLLLSTNLVDSPFPVYPLGAAHLAGALEEAGHRVDHFDLLSGGGDSSFEAFIKNSKYDLIAVSIRNLDTTDSSIPVSFVHHTSKFVALIRRYSSALVVIGGPAFSIMPQEIYDILSPDYGVVGEGEQILPWLADCLAKKKLPAKGIIRADRLASPWLPVSYKKPIASHYVQYGGMLNIQTKRGCPFECSYCSYPLLEGKKLRFRDPQEVAEEVERLTGEFGAKYIFFADAVFNDPADRFLEIGEALIRKGNKTPWCGFFRPVGLTYEKISLLKRAGLAAMELGTDASTDETLAGLNKGFSFADVVQVNEAAVAAKVPAAHFIIFGGPGENPKTLAKGLANIEMLKHSVVFGFIGIRILPDTRIFDLAVKEGICKGDDLLEPLFYYSNEISRSQIDETVKQAWQGRFDRIYPWSEMEPRIKRLHQKGYLGPMWDFLIKR